MKKTMILLLGVLLASALPGNGLKAQAKRVSVKVKTIDRAAIDTAILFNAASSTDTLCIDPTDASLYSYTGTAIPVNTLAQRWTTLNFSSDSVWGMVNHTYTNAVIVVRDVNGRHYIWGNASQEMLEMGVFRGADLFADADTTYQTLTAESHMLRSAYAGNATVARDNEYVYTSITKAAALTSYPNISLTANVPASQNDTVNAPMNLFLEGYKVLGALRLQGDTTIIISGNDGSAVNALYGITGTGIVRIIRIDSVGNLSAGTHPVEILDGRFRYVVPSANITISGGKFSQGPATLGSYIAPGSFLYDNPDADASIFPYKVANDGFRVTLVNFDASGNDSIIRCEGGLIVPAIARPSYVPAQWLFQHYYTDAAFINPWHFDTSNVTSDTILYAKWVQFVATENSLLRVNHYLQELDGTYSLESTDEYAYPLSGPNVTILANYVPGFTATVLSQAYTLPGVAGQVDTIDFYYDRNTYQLTWNINWGSITNATMDLTDSVVSMLYGEPIVFPNVTRPGYHVDGWSYLGTTMPNRNLTIMPFYARNRYTVVWNGPDTALYTAQDQLPSITAYATSAYDTISLTDADFVVTNNQGDTVTDAVNVIGSPYTIKAVPADENYRMDYNMVHYLTIVPYTVNAENIEVETVKVYDGTQNVRSVINAGNPDVVLSNAAGVEDDLTIENVTVENVRFNDQQPGENKVITAYGITLGGLAASNYVLAEDTLIISLEGVILYFGLNDTLVGGFDADFKGYCNDNSYQVEFHLAEEATNPDMYSLNYESDLFTDVISATINQSGFVDIVIPDGTPAGEYNVDVVFWSSAYPTYKSDPFTLTFIVNLDKDVIMPIFEDVMTVMNADPNMIIDTNSITWYHNDSVVGHGPFYQEEGGMLTGEYYVEFTYSDSNGVTRTARSCVQENLVDYPTAPVEATVKAYPNPTVNTVNIAIENATQYTHTLRVMNIMGVTLLNTTFNGDVTSIDFSSFGNGSYTVSVDGMVVRVIKK